MFYHPNQITSNHIETNHFKHQPNISSMFFNREKNPTPGPRWIYFRVSHLTCQAPTPYAFWRPRVKPPSSRSGKHEDDCGKGCCFCEAYAMSYKKNVNIIYNVYVRKRYETVALFLYCRERERQHNWGSGEDVHIKPFMSLRVRCDWFCQKDRVIGFVMSKEQCLSKLHWSDGSIVFNKSHYYKHKWWLLPRIFSEIHTNLVVFRFWKIGLFDIYHFVIWGSVYFF